MSDKEARSAVASDTAVPADVGADYFLALANRLTAIRDQCVQFHALLPATPKPSSGYPVVIYGHGLGDSQYGGPSAVAPVMVSSGFAMISINAVGHGYGPESAVIVNPESTLEAYA